MTNEELKAELHNVESRLREQIEVVHRDTMATRALITGNGNPDSGLWTRFGTVERQVKLLSRLALAFAMAVCSALGYYTVERYVTRDVTQGETHVRQPSLH